MGLATVYGIVSQGGGHIRVRSGKDEGTTWLTYYERDWIRVCLRAVEVPVARRCLAKPVDRAE
jgi:signal transduction histidine kinase